MPRFEIVRGELLSSYEPHDIEGAKSGQRREGRPMRHFTAMPDASTLIGAALDTTMRPSKGMPSVLAVGGYHVVANVTRALRVDAGAVYYVPPRHTPHRSPKPGELIVVTGSWARLPSGAHRLDEHGRRVVQWCVGMLGEVAP